MSSRLFLIQLPVSYVYCQREKQQQHLFRAYSKFQSIKEYYGELLLFMFVELYRFLQILIFCVKWHCAGLFPIRQSNSLKYCLTVVVAIDAGGKMKWLRYKKNRNAFSTPQKWIRVPQINSAPVGFSIVGRWCLTSLEADNTCGKHEQLCSSETLVSVWEWFNTTMQRATKSLALHTRDRLAAIPAQPTNLVLLLIPPGWWESKHN